MQIEATKPPKKGNDLVTELMLKYAFFYHFDLIKRCKVKQYNDDYKHIRCCWVFMVNRFRLPTKDYSHRSIPRFHKIHALHGKLNIHFLARSDALIHQRA